MKIGIDAQLIGRPGGVGGYVAALLRALALHDNGPDANDYVIYTTRGAVLPKEVEGAGFTVRRTSLTNVRLCRVLWQQLLLPRRLVEDGVALLHAPSYAAPNARQDVPVVLTLHDMLAFTHPRLCSWANARHYRRVVPRAARNASLIIASSSATRDDAVAILGVAPDKVRVVHPGVDECFRRVTDEGALRAVRECHRLPERFILFVGNVEPKKGLDGLLVAYEALLREANMPHDLLIVGSLQRGASRLRALRRKLGLQARVRFVGHVPRSDLPAVYSLADLFVFPSLHEGFGLPPLEAMACGTPVVCSNAGALPEVVGDAAMMTSPAAPGELCRAMASALADKAARERLISRGVERARLFTWRAAAGKILTAYRDAAKTAGRPE